MVCHWEGDKMVQTVTKSKGSMTTVTKLTRTIEADGKMVALAEEVGMTYKVVFVKAA